MKMEFQVLYVGVSKNRGTTKKSILIGFSLIFTIHFGGFPPIFGSTPMCSIDFSGWRKIELPLGILAHVKEKTLCSQESGSDDLSSLANLHLQPTKSEPWATKKVLVGWDYIGDYTTHYKDPY